jgi:hypothetical protein
MSETLYISICLRLIEQKVNRGDSEHWTNEDYKILQKAIFDASSINLSTYTLERLYGKLKIHKNYRPQVETKNALVIYLGYNDWEDFKNQDPIEIKKALEAPGPALDNTVIEQPNTQQSSSNNISKKGPTLFLTAACMIVVAIGLLLLNRKSVVSDSINFKAVDAYGKAPHTVKFVYDLSGQEGDDFSIYVPDFRDTIKIAKGEKFTLRPYLKPGWFRAFLLNKKKVIGQTLFFIETPGWYATGTSYNYRNDGHTWPLSKKAVASDGKLYTPLSLLPDSVKNRYGYYFLCYFNVRNFDVSGDNVAFETRFRNKTQEANSHCNDMWFRLIGMNGVSQMHFLTTGCTGYVDMAFGDKKLSGSKEVLTQFGLNMHTWKKARLEINKKNVRIYLDGTLILKTQYSKSVGQIVGIEVTSRINGETDYVKLYNSANKLIYEDDFGGKAIE